VRGIFENATKFFKKLFHSIHHHYYKNMKVNISHFND